MVNIVKQTGLEKEQTFVAPLALTHDRLQQQFPTAQEGAAFSYAVTFLDPTSKTLEELLKILNFVNLPFGGQEHTNILEGFRNGQIPIDNLGVVNTAKNLPNGKHLFWYFVKSPKDEEGTEFTLRSAYPDSEEMMGLTAETDALYRRSGVIYGLVRSFSRLVLPEMGGTTGCTIDLRDDHCGSVTPLFGVNVRLKTIEVEVDPKLEGEPLKAIIKETTQGIKTLGCFETPIRMPHLARRRQAVESLREFLKSQGANEKEYLYVYPDLMSQNEISPGE